MILTHKNFFYTDGSQTTSGNMPIEESFALMDFLGSQDVSLVFQGHDHIRDEAESPEYVKVQVAMDHIDLDWQLIQ